MTANAESRALSLALLAAWALWLAVLIVLGLNAWGRPRSADAPVVPLKPPPEANRP
ncbi:MAG: hypothetical protein HS116_23585 [Planctomycetes bacterium]|nr:hypothetical protein [Planctomycetota bacterium]